MSGQARSPSETRQAVLQLICDRALLITESDLLHHLGWLQSYPITQNAKQRAKARLKFRHDLRPLIDAGAVVLFKAPFPEPVNDNLIRDGCGPLVTACSWDPGDGLGLPPDFQRVAAELERRWPFDPAAQSHDHIFVGAPKYFRRTDQPEYRGTWCYSHADHFDVLARTGCVSEQDSEQGGPQSPSAAHVELFHLFTSSYHMFHAYLQHEITIQLPAEQRRGPRKFKEAGWRLFTLKGHLPYALLGDWDPRQPEKTREKTSKRKSVPLRPWRGGPPPMDYLGQPLLVNEPLDEGLLGWGLRTADEIREIHGICEANGTFFELR